MDDFIATVLMNDDNEPSELLTFGNTPEEVIDNIIQMETVRILYHIRRVKDSEIWDFDSELEPFRKLRKMIHEKEFGEISLKFGIGDS